MIIVRELQDGETVSEQAFGQLPIRIGRDRDNDFVLLDDSVSGSHAIIERSEDGKIVLIDSGSKNGTRLQGEKIQKVEIQEAKRFLLGLAEIEVLVYEKQLTREVDISEWDFRERRRGPTHYFISLLIVGLSVSIYKFASLRFWSVFREHRYLVLAQDILIYCIISFIFSLLLLMSLRAVGRKVRLADTLRSIAWLSIPFGFLPLIDGVLFYTLKTGLIVLVHDVLLYLLLVGSIVYLFGIRNPKPTMRSHFTTGAIAAAVLLSLWTLHYMRSKDEPLQHLSLNQFPPIGSYVGPTESLQDLKNSMEKITKKIDERVKEASKNHNL